MTSRPLTQRRCIISKLAPCPNKTNCTALHLRVGSLLTQPQVQTKNLAEIAMPPTSQALQWSSPLVPSVHYQAHLISRMMPTTTLRTIPWISSHRINSKTSSSSPNNSLLPSLEPQTGTLLLRLHMVAKVKTALTQISTLVNAQLRVLPLAHHRIKIKSWKLILELMNEHTIQPDNFSNLPFTLYELL